MKIIALKHEFDSETQHIRLVEQPERVYVCIDRTKIIVECRCSKDYVLPGYAACAFCNTVGEHECYDFNTAFVSTRLHPILMQLNVCVLAEYTRDWRKLYSQFPRYTPTDIFLKGP